MATFPNLLGVDVPNIPSFSWTVEQLAAIVGDISSIQQKDKEIGQRTCESACYEELGCFDTCRGLLRHVMKLPVSPSEMAVTFTWFSR